MKILDDIKFDFSDVLLLPKRSTYSSRSQVSLERTLKFKYSKYEWTGIPIMVSNMDTTGTIEMAMELQKHKIITCLHKFYTWSDIPLSLDKNYYAITSGIKDTDLENLDEIMKNVDPNIICLDVANGYMSKFINTCDAMLHARDRGESFGLSIAEFLSLNKPVLAWNGGHDLNHLDMLKDSGLLYNDASHLNYMLHNLSEFKQDWTKRVEQFKPVPVMNKFKEVFI
jgi:hypothetical protein